MQLTHEFEVPVGAEDAWRILTDLERVAPCMPGATVERGEGDEYRGTMRVKVGPIQLTYRGTARFVERDEGARRAVLEANGQETRGSGTARATITATCGETSPGVTSVSVVTDLSVTGRPAQFGRGVLGDVGDKLLGRFAECLADEVVAGTPGHAAEEADGEQTQRRPHGAAARHRGESLDLVEVAGLPVLRRLAPLLLLVVVAALVWWVSRGGNG